MENTYTRANKIYTQADRKHNKTEIIYFIKQKLIGISLLVAGIIAPVILDGDGTISIIGVPLGLFLIFTKNKVMDF